jgi:hypothetical protein
MAPDADVEAQQAEHLGPAEQRAGAAQAGLFAGEGVERMYITEGRKVATVSTAITQ